MLLSKRIIFIFSKCQAKKRLCRFLHRRKFKSFLDSEKYWKQRYQFGGHSGSGSYGRLAAFKAAVLNNFVCENNVNSIIEYGCGDGNQLKLASYPKYIGFDVSIDAISACRRLFHQDSTKSFYLMNQYNGERADLTLSLDVIYHLVEDHVFERYMERLFDTADRFVIIYSSNFDDTENKVPHVKHRACAKWIADNLDHWALVKYVPNQYPYKGNNHEGSFADFFIYQKIT